MTTQQPVLIIGGSGFVGALAARTLRKLHPALPIAIGGRNLEKANAVAKEVGNAEAVIVDLARKDLGLPAEKSFSAVVMFVYDDTLNALQYALANSQPYLSFSSSIHEIVPEVAQFAHKPTAPVLMGGSWLAGATSLVTAHFAKQFRSVTSIEITSLFDEQDVGGPAAEADFVRLTSTPNTMLLDNGRWRWVPAGDQGKTFKSVDGRQIAAQTYSPFDVFSLPATTGARSVRFDFAFGETSGRRRGEHFSAEFAVEIEGERKDGSVGRSRYEFIHPQGQAPVTALAVTLAVERLIGLDGRAPAAPGVYFPEMLVDPDHAIDRLKEFGARISQTT
jgi:saccharopine dehydrogenase-like NADP-dependent oxidoreductase